MNFVARAEAETGPRLMQHGDLTIIYERHDSLNHVYLSRGEILNNKFGAFYHDDLIGRPFGSKIVSRNTTGWMYALEPSPELWSLAVHTRTQIVNELDASIITFNLDVFPGCVVVESGTDYVDVLIEIVHIRNVFVCSFRGHCLFLFHLVKILFALLSYTLRASQSDSSLSV
jgi:tRNA methyltransferase complex GCD14 subunit